MTITRGTAKNWLVGLTYSRYDGKPSISDPMGEAVGIGIALCLGFINFGWRWMKAAK